MNVISTESKKMKLISDPPGGILIWIVIYLELLTYGLAFLSLAYYGVQERTLFHEGRLLLNKQIAVVNTIFLLTSGFFVAMAVHVFREKQIKKASNFLLYAVLFGLAFLILKMIEYYDKIQAGFVMDSSTFFMFYWLMTGFHWIHVFVGVIILFFIRRTIIKKEQNADLDDIEAGAAFWHLCDLIWLILFPMLYLLF